MAIVSHAEWNTQASASTVSSRCAESMLAQAAGTVSARAVSSHEIWQVQKPALVPIHRPVPCGAC